MEVSAEAHDTKGIPGGSEEDIALGPRTLDQTLVVDSKRDHNPKFRQHDSGDQWSWQQSPWAFRQRIVLN